MWRQVEFVMGCLSGSKNECLRGENFLPCLSNLRPRYMSLGAINYSLILINRVNPGYLCFQLDFLTGV